MVSKINIELKSFKYMNIKNRKKLLSEELDNSIRELREIGLDALEGAIDAVKPKNLMENAIKLQKNSLWVFNDEYALDNFENIYIIGGGKATAAMTQYLEKLLIQSDYTNYKGVINIQKGLKLNEKSLSARIQLVYASHPIPDKDGIHGVKKMMELVKKSTQNDLFICLLSGGGSALLPLPKNQITLEEMKRVNSLLLKSGANIHEINAIRKHLSAIKGGNLAMYINQESGATLISLIISDVIGNDLDVIASGPTVPDKSTFKEALNVLAKYDLIEEIPEQVIRLIKRGTEGLERETPKRDNACFKNVYNYLIGSIESGVVAVKEFLASKNFHVEYFSNEVSGEAKDFGIQIYSLLQNILQKEFKGDNTDKVALIGSGELTVTITGDGIGGRNQEMLLSFVNYVKNKDISANFVIIGANLDGIEGNSRAMGALVDNRVIELTRRLSLNSRLYLKKNDSNTYFKKIGTEILTGATGCNVNDLIMILVK
ncbi:MAG: glycerate kinase type-2 family protein [Promethearchaeia archaeon]